MQLHMPLRPNGLRAQNARNASQRDRLRPCPDAWTSRVRTRVHIFQATSRARRHTPISCDLNHNASTDNSPESDEQRGASVPSHRAFVDLPRAKINEDERQRRLNELHRARAAHGFSTHEQKRPPTTHKANLGSRWRRFGVAAGVFCGLGVLSVAGAFARPAVAHASASPSTPLTTTTTVIDPSGKHPSKANAPECPECKYGGARARPS